MNWSLPYSANLTLRQVGLILFLAGIGTRAGYALRQTAGDREGLQMLLAAGLLTFSVSVMALLTLRLLRIPFGVATGMLAALQTQPAVLSFALEQSEDDLPNIGYAQVFPIATIGKIIMAQVLLSLLL